MHFIIRHKRPMHPNRVPAARRHVQHVPHSQQGLGPHLIQNRARIDLARYLKRHPGRNIRFNQARNHIHRRALGCQNQMQTRRPGFLRNPRNQFFHLFTHHHHQIRQFIDDDHNRGQFFQRFRRIRGNTEWIRDQDFIFRRLSDFAVVARQIAHPQMRHQFIATFHFIHRPIQGMASMFHVRHHRGQQMRNAFIHRHFQHFRVDQNQTHILRFGFIQQR